ncbi:MAG: hypothetical protein ABIH23_21445 [bacterium]
MYGLFWELCQTSHITGAGRKATQASEQVAYVSSHVHELEARIDKLTLISMALWSLLQQVSDLTEEDLIERVKEIDLSDGVLDGKVRQPAVKCPQCNRTMSQKHRRCLYCGYDQSEQADAFGGMPPE